MPRSRSRSMLSSTWSAISRSASPPHIWMKRSASVDLPWSMCAMMEKLRMRDWAINKEGARGTLLWAAILSQLGHGLGGQPVSTHLNIFFDKDRHIHAIAILELGVGV